MHTYPEGSAFTTLDAIAGKKITVMGLGLNGGGEAAVRFLYRHGAQLTVTDMKTAEELKQTMDSLSADPDISMADIKFVLGCHQIEDFENADIVIKNPGVKYEGNKFLAAAKAVETDISIFLHFSKSPIIAVTGSKGKSSTVSAIQHGLKYAGLNSFLGGNITVSPLTFIDKTDSSTPVVLELSSWQLADLRGRKLLAPKIAVLTKIVPDHQNWYGSMESYVADKKLIFADQTPQDYTICDFDDSWGREFSRETKGTVAWYSMTSLDNYSTPLRGAWIDGSGKGWVILPFIPESYISVMSKSPDATRFAVNFPVCIVDKLLVPGFHMKQNILNAALVLVLCGIHPDTVRESMAAFPGIHHRLEFFHQIEMNSAEQICGGKTSSGSTITLKFYNDSAATVPEAASAAVNSFTKNIHLICGGTDKQLDFTPLAENAHKALSIFLLKGNGTDKLITMLRERNIAYHGPYESTDALLSDFREYSKTLREGEHNVLFSPGATSFGMFKNEFDRGNTWKAKTVDYFKI